MATTQGPEVGAGALMAGVPALAGIGAMAGELFARLANVSGGAFNPEQAATFGAELAAGVALGGLARLRAARAGKEGHLVAQFGWWVAALVPYALTGAELSRRMFPGRPYAPVVGAVLLTVAGMSADVAALVNQDATPDPSPDATAPPTTELP